MDRVFDRRRYIPSARDAQNPPKRRMVGKAARKEDWLNDSTRPSEASESIKALRKLKGSNEIPREKVAKIRQTLSKSAQRV
ncbi:MAG: hypothetical protein A2Z45_03645 [Chloroflexi bacterium RBG_19FT_COMBO_55_16]|nr:MAG: hypothetical protein A2Z45_03645 [Chloroflexi bacterium RBG_19FT_COMBO_55_16]